MTTRDIAKRLRITHVTGYRYEGYVNASYNEVRVTPQSSQRQSVLDSRVVVTPDTQLYTYKDYWGSAVVAFDIQVPHQELKVTATSVVETYSSAAYGILPESELLELPGLGPDNDPKPGPISWDSLSMDTVVGDWVEFLMPTALANIDPEIRTIAGKIRSESSLPLHAAVRTVEWVKSNLSYERGATNAHTTATEALTRKMGVCQDFAHLALSLLRATGIPARYVSGYLHPNPEVGIGKTVVGESHAWVEAWLGEWVPFDPTAKGTMSDGHVMVATGRDYSDVAPMKGIFSGSKASDPQVVVEITQER